MDGNRGLPAEPGGDDPAGASGEGERADPGDPSHGVAAAHERYGPLELRRLQKEDGRTLIVYSRVERGR